MIDLKQAYMKNDFFQFFYQLVGILKKRSKLKATY